MTQLIEKLKQADLETQIKQCAKLALDGDWQTARAVGGVDLVRAVAIKLEKAEEKVRAKK